jgi:hypothetical protein
MIHVTYRLKVQLLSLTLKIFKELALIFPIFSSQVLYVLPELQLYQINISRVQDSILFSHTTVLSAEPVCSSILFTRKLLVFLQYRLISVKSFLFLIIPIFTLYQWRHRYCSMKFHKVENV